MASQVYRVNKPKEYRKAGPDDLIELLPLPGQNPLYLPKSIIEKLVYGIVSREIIHLSGPTGSGKSSVIESFCLVPENFQAVCLGLGFPALPIKLYAIEMATYEAPSELFSRRIIRDSNTLDEDSKLVQSLVDATQGNGKYYPLIWLREMGRVHSASVQGGLLDLVYKGTIFLPDDRRLDGQGIAWIADSNYQAENDATYTLVTLCEALKRRFMINLTLDYLSASQEVQILEHILKRTNISRIDKQLLDKVAKLGNLIREQRLEGNLQSLPPPTIYGYLAFLRMVQALPHLDKMQIAFATFLGNASQEDHRTAKNFYNQVFGLLKEGEDVAPLEGNHI